ncbi:ABC transporter permease [Bradyrhizobium sp. URHD0069]|jgi:NitT/TauT family transport system permease protein|uniref:ABC transporter permease n=1 Tax=Bradyrhizobium sp. URHD0069 TaxID=1380355 RepID=UPI00056C999D
MQRLAPWLATAAFVAVWWLCVVIFDIKSFVLPSPWEAVKAIYQFRYPLFVHGLATLTTTLVGFAIAVAFGMVLGILVGSSRLAYSALYPLLVGFNSVPKAALVPVLVIWFGAGTVPAVITAFMLSFFPVVANVATAFATIEPELLEVMRSLGASQRDMTLKIGIPRSLPFFFASLKIAITLAFVGSVIAEIVAGNSGIGNVMLIASSNFNIPLVFAALLVVGFMGVGMYAIFDFFERRMTSWSIRGAGAQFAGGG